MFMKKKQPCFKCDTCVRVQSYVRAKPQLSRPNWSIKIQGSKCIYVRTPVTRDKNFIFLESRTKLFAVAVARVDESTISRKLIIGTYVLTLNSLNV